MGFWCVVLLSLFHLSNLWLCSNILFQIADKLQLPCVLLTTKGPASCYTNNSVVDPIDPVYPTLPVALLCCLLFQVADHLPNAPAVLVTAGDEGAAYCCRSTKGEHTGFVPVFKVRKSDSDDFDALNE